MMPEYDIFTDVDAAEAERAERGAKLVAMNKLLRVRDSLMHCRDGEERDICWIEGIEADGELSRCFECATDTWIVLWNTLAYSFTEPQEWEWWIVNVDPEAGTWEKVKDGTITSVGVAPTMRAIIAQEMVV
jgi:hypothetical protein